MTKGRRTEVEVSEPKYRVRSKEVEVERSKYRKCRRYENGRRTEKVELMRTMVFSTKHDRQKFCFLQQIMKLKKPKRFV